MSTIEHGSKVTLTILKLQAATPMFVWTRTFLKRKIYLLLFGWICDFMLLLIVSLMNNFSTLNILQLQFVEANRGTTFVGQLLFGMFVLTLSLMRINCFLWWGWLLWFGTAFWGWIIFAFGSFSALFFYVY